MTHVPYDRIPPRVAALLRAPITRWEGGYVDRPDDHGGPTNHGVTLATLRAWRGDPTLTAADVRRITVEEAVEIAYDLFYRGLGFDLLPLSRTAAVYLDWAWGSPQRKVIKRLQGQIGLPETAIDGRIGPATAAAFAAYLQRVGDAAAVNIASDLRCRFYRAIVATNPSQALFLAGWLNRAEWGRQQPLPPP